MHRARTAFVALAVLAGGCGGLDQAELVDPGDGRVEADPGELRVLRHHDDPPAGERWIDVLDADPEVAVRTGSFRESGSRHAEAHQPADVRLLYEATGPGRTLVVRMDCRGCGDLGVPTTRPQDTPLHVWELAVGGGDRLALGLEALVAGDVADVRVGDHVVVVREDDVEPTPLADDAVLRLVATRSEAPALDVFAVVAPGAGAAVYGERRYGVRAVAG